MPASVILATAGYDHTIRFWDPSGICYRTIQYADSQINKLEITPDKQYIAAAGNPHVRLFEVNTNNPNPVSLNNQQKKTSNLINYFILILFLFYPRLLALMDTRIMLLPLDFKKKGNGCIQVQRITL